MHTAKDNRVCLILTHLDYVSTLVAFALRKMARTARDVSKSRRDYHNDTSIALLLNVK